jgi:quinol monooxygenase YgiN
LKDLRDQLIEVARKEKGTLRYDWFIDTKEPAVGVILEVYESMEAFQAHCNTEQFKKFI